MDAFCLTTLTKINEHVAIAKVSSTMNGVNSGTVGVGELVLGDRVGCGVVAIAVNVIEFEVAIGSVGLSQLWSQQ